MSCVQSGPAAVYEAQPNGEAKTGIAEYEESVLVQAAAILEQRAKKLDAMSHPAACSEFLRMRLAALPYEAFTVLFLDSRYRIITVEEMFRGSIDGASVHPREVVRRCLANNAAAVILAHNHPSGNPEPSQADREITRHLRQALELIEVRVLDHFVVGTEGIVSLAERGWL